MNIEKLYFGNYLILENYNLGFLSPPLLK